MSNINVCTRNINLQAACDGAHKLNWRELWRRWRRNSLTRQQLAAMDSHLMKDIGVTRADLLQEISKPFWKD